MNFIQIQDFSVKYGENEALSNISIDIEPNSICAFIGPSGCGKTTLLRSINRLNDLVKSFSATGDILVNGNSVYKTNKKEAISELRRSMGMVFQKPNPLPLSIRENLLLPLKEYYHEKKSVSEKKIIEKLKLAGLYEEIQGRLDMSAFSLSGGQQQRLCIARALLLEPKILLLDEPCAALDPISTFKIEELLRALKKEYTVVIVTHNMEQAKRISDQTAFFYQGKLSESGQTDAIFNHPQTDKFYRFVTGKLIEDQPEQDENLHTA